MKKNKNKKEKRIPIILDEAVIYSILNKIISSAIRISDTKRIYKDLDIHCFNFLKKQIEPCLLTKYLPHETIIDSNYNSNEVNDFFYNASKISKKEIWININEPKPSKIDRSATRNILFKFIKSSNKSISKFSNKHLQDNNKYNYNILNNKEKNNDVKINDETLNIKIEENKNSDNINNNEIKEENDEYKDYKVIIRKKKKKHVSVSIYGVKYEKEEIDKIIEMPSFDIINENNEKNKKNKIIKYNEEYINYHEKSINKDIIDNKISNIENNVLKKKEKNNIKDSYEDIYKDYKVIIRKKRYINESVFGIKHIKEEIDKIIEMPSFDILNYI